MCHHGKTPPQKRKRSRKQTGGRVFFFGETPCNQPLKRAPTTWMRLHNGETKKVADCMLPGLISPWADDLATPRRASWPHVWPSPGALGGSLGSHLNGRKGCFLFWGFPRRPAILEIQGVLPPCVYALRHGLLWLLRGIWKHWVWQCLLVAEAIAQLAHLDLIL